MPKKTRRPEPDVEVRDHWFKVFFRRLPLSVRLVTIGLIGVFLVALPLLIVFLPWELRREPPEGALTGLPALTADVARPTGWLVFQPVEGRVCLALNMDTGERLWLSDPPAEPGEGASDALTIAGPRLTLSQFPEDIVVQTRSRLEAAVLSPDRRWVAFQYAADLRQAMGRYGIGLVDLEDGSVQRMMPLTVADETIDQSAGIGAIWWLEAEPAGLVDARHPAP